VKKDDDRKNEAIKGHFVFGKNITALYAGPVGRAFLLSFERKKAETFVSAFMELMAGFEPATSSLSGESSSGKDVQVALFYVGSCGIPKDFYLFGYGQCTSFDNRPVRRTNVNISLEIRHVLFGIPGMNQC